MTALLSNNFEQVAGMLTYAEQVSLIQHYDGIASPTPPETDRLRFPAHLAWLLAQAPATKISARDYDALIAFSDMSVTGKWLHFGVRRLASPTSLWIGFSASNAGAGYSSWIASTTQVTPLGTSALVGWYRWIWVLSGGATLKMYLNGVDQAFTKDVDTGGPSEGQFLATTACNCITLMGRRRSSGYDEQWGAGKYDEAYWFSRPFSAGEVATLDAYLVTKLTEITG